MFHQQNEVTTGNEIERITGARTKRKTTFRIGELMDQLPGRDLTITQDEIDQPIEAAPTCCGVPMVMEEFVATRNGVPIDPQDFKTVDDFEGYYVSLTTVPYLAGERIVTSYERSMAITDDATGQLNDDEYMPDFDASSTNRESMFDGMDDDFDEDDIFVDACYHCSKFTSSGTGLCFTCEQAEEEMFRTYTDEPQGYDTMDRAKPIIRNDKGFTKLCGTSHEGCVRSIRISKQNFKAQFRRELSADNRAFKFEASYMCGVPIGGGSGVKRLELEHVTQIPRKPYEGFEAVISLAYVRR